MAKQYDEEKDIGYHVEFHDSNMEKQSRISASSSTQVSVEAAESLAKKLGYDTFEMFTTTTEIKRYTVENKDE